MLLISYVFPPTQSSGSLRWQKLSHYFAERGWFIDAVTLDPACLASTDPARLSDLPEGTRVYGVPTSTLRVERGIKAAWHMYRQLRPGNSVAASRGTQTGTVSSRSATQRPSSIGRNEVRWSLGSSRGFVRAYSAWLQYAREGRWALYGKQE